MICGFCTEEGLQGHYLRDSCYAAVLVFECSGTQERAGLPERPSLVRRGSSRIDYPGTAPVCWIQQIVRSLIGIGIGTEDDLILDRYDGDDRDLIGEQLEQIADRVVALSEHIL